MSCSSSSQKTAFLGVHGICSMSAINQYQLIWQVIFLSVRSSALWKGVETRPKFLQIFLDRLVAMCNGWLYVHTILYRELGCTRCFCCCCCCRVTCVLIRRAAANPPETSNPDRNTTTQQSTVNLLAACVFVLDKLQQQQQQLLQMHGRCGKQNNTISTEHTNAANSRSTLLSTRRSPQPALERLPWMLIQRVIAIVTVPRRPFLCFPAP